MFSLQKKCGLGNFLVNKGIISVEELKKALNLQKTKGSKRIGEILREINSIGEEEMLEQLAKYLQVDYIILSEVDFKLDEQQLFTKSIMLDWCFAAFKIEENIVSIAVSDIYDFELQEKIQNMAKGFQVRFYLSLDSMITDYIKKAYSKDLDTFGFKGRRERFGEYLVRKGIITEEHVQAALSEQQKFLDKRIGEILIQMNIINQEKTLMELASHLKKDYIWLDDIKPDKTLASLFDASYMLENLFVPFKVGKDSAEIAISNIFDFELIEIIETRLIKNRLKGRFCLANKEQIQRFIEEIVR